MTESICRLCLPRINHRNLNTILCSASSDWLINIATAARLTSNISQQINDLKISTWCCKLWNVFANKSLVKCWPASAGFLLCISFFKPCQNLFLTDLYISNSWFYNFISFYWWIHSKLQTEMQQGKHKKASLPTMLAIVVFLY